MTPTLESDIESKVKASREALDAWVREIIAWHFDPATGCQFWLDFAAGLDWDPRREIRTYEDLDRFGFVQEDWLRGGPLRRWIPKAYAGKPAYVFEIETASGAPLLRASVEDFRRDFEALSAVLPDEAFPPGADWLQMAATGPRILRLGIEHLAQHRGGICFMVDQDPRWVGKQIKAGQIERAEAYKQHVIEQALTLLRAHDNIQCLFTTPKLLEALCEKISLKKAGIKGVLCDGADLTAQSYRLAVEELARGLCFVPILTNALMGVAMPKPVENGNGYLAVYYPSVPRAVIDIVDPSEPYRRVPYGATGRVRLAALTREFFIPRFLQPELSDRERPCALFPWDGAGNIRR